MVVYTLKQCWETLRRYFKKKNKQINHLFRWSSFWYWRVCKQTKLSHLGHRKPACIYWKADAPKTSYCLVRMLVQMHNSAILLRKWARSERIFVHKNWKEGCWQHLVSTGTWGAKCHTVETTLDVLRPVFEERIISELRFDTVGLIFVGCRQR